LPLTPTRTALTTKWLVHRDAVEGVDYDLEELTHVWLATNEQDRRIVGENQIGMNCPAYEPGSLSPVTENGVRQFVDWYCSRLEQRLSRDAVAQRLVGPAGQPVEGADGRGAQNEASKQISPCTAT
jgi:stachydrine N-demethylase